MRWKTMERKEEEEEKRTGNDVRGDDLCMISVKIKDGQGSDTRLTNLAQGVRVLCLGSRGGSRRGDICMAAPTVVRRGAARRLAKTSTGALERHAGCKRTSREQCATGLR